MWRHIDIAVRHTSSAYNNVKFVFANTTFEDSVNDVTLKVDKRREGHAKDSQMKIKVKVDGHNSK